MSNPGKTHASLKEFTNALIDFSINLSGNCSKDTANHEEHILLLSEIYRMITLVLHYNRNNRTDILNCILKNGLIRNMMDIVTQADFNLKHVSERQLTFDATRVINMLFGDSYNSEIIKELGGTFANDRRSSKLLTVMKDVIVASSVNKKSNLVDTINEALKHMTMSYEGGL